MLMCWNILTKATVPPKGLFGLRKFMSQFIIQRFRAPKKDLKEKARGNVAYWFIYWLLFSLLSYMPRTSILGMVLPTMDCAYLNQDNVTLMSQANLIKHFFNYGSFFSSNSRMSLVGTNNELGYPKKLCLQTPYLLSPLPPLPSSHLPSLPPLPHPCLTPPLILLKNNLKYVEELVLNAGQ